MIEECAMEEENASKEKEERFVNVSTDSREIHVKLESNNCSYTIIIK